MLRSIGKQSGEYVDMEYDRWWTFLKEKKLRKNARKTNFNLDLFGEIQTATTTFIAFYAFPLKRKNFLQRFLTSMAIYI